MNLTFIKLAFRSIKRNISITIINILGLTLGITSALLILFWVVEEKSYDKFHENYESTVRVLSYGTKYMTEGFIGSPFPLANTIVEDFPEVKQATRISNMSTDNYLKVGENTFYERYGMFVDSTFFDVFSFEFISGDIKTCLLSPYSIVITESLAKKYFGDTDALGKTIKSNYYTHTVSAIVKDLPDNSSLKFDYLVPLRILFDNGYPSNHWSMYMATLYIVLEPDANYSDLEQKLYQIALDNKSAQVIDGGVRFKLQDFADVHLDEKHGAYLKYMDVTNKDNLFIFLSISILILVLAVINYINISTANANQRRKEIGIKKISGAHKSSLIRQFFGEAFILIFVSVDLSILFIELLIPAFNRLAGKQLDGSILLNPITIIVILSVLIVTWLLSSIYPAFFLSSFKIQHVLKGNYEKGKFSIMGNFKKLMVIFQFFISITLITATIIIYQQLNFIKHKDLGFELQNIIHIPIDGDYLNLKSELLKYPDISHVSIQDYLWATNQNRMTGFYWEGKDKDFQIDMLIPRVDFDFFQTMQIDFLNGRSFSSNYSTDSINAYILNETAVKKTGINNPLETSFGMWRDGEYKMGKIIGVFKDIHYQSFHKEYEPMVVRLFETKQGDKVSGNMLIRSTGKNRSETIAHIKQAWSKFNPDTPLEYYYLEETYKNLYSKERSVASIVFIFALLTIIISALGLFGLSSFLIDRRTKEIGIRKVSGATISSINLLISLDFIKWIILSFILSAPLVYYALNKWISNFAYHTNINPIPFILGLLITLAITYFTIFYKTTKAARLNPVKSLRYE